MNQKTRNIIGWVLTGLITALFLFSASAKLMGGEKSAQMASALGFSLSTLQILAVLEITSIVLFIIPRTGMLGTLLVAAYLGGAIATHLEHQQSAAMAIAVQCVVWITAAIRFPELSRRILGKEQHTLK